MCYLYASKYVEIFISYFILKMDVHMWYSPVKCNCFTLTIISMHCKQQQLSGENWCAIPISPELHIMNFTFDVNIVHIMDQSSSWSEEWVIKEDSSAYMHQLWSLSCNVDLWKCNFTERKHYETMKTKTLLLRKFWKWIHVDRFVYGSINVH